MEGHPYEKGSDVQRKIELKPESRQIWACLKLYLTPKRYHLKMRFLISLNAS